MPPRMNGNKNKSKSKSKSKNKNKHVVAADPSPWQIPSYPVAQVLLRVFEVFCNDHEFEREVEYYELPHPQLSDRPCLLSEVCRYWRELALSHSPLWKTVDFNTPAEAVLCLQRSGVTTPLHVVLVEARRSPISTGGWPFDKDYSPLLRPHSSRIESLHLGIGHPEDFKGERTQWLIDSPLTPGIFKELRILGSQHYDDDWHGEEDLRCLLEDYYSPIRIQAIEAFSRLPALTSVTRLTLIGFEIPLSCPIYDNLVELELFSFRPLLAVSDVLDLCRRSPRLQVLKLCLAYENTLPDNAEMVRVVFLPELRRMKLKPHTTASTEFLLSRLATPSLEHFDVILKAPEGKAGHELYRLLAPLTDCPLTRGIRRIIIRNGQRNEEAEIRGYYNPKFREFDTYGHGQPDPEEEDYAELERDGLHICVEDSPWDGHVGAPFLSKFQNLTHIEFNCDDTDQLCALLNGTNISHLRLENTYFEELQHLRPGAVLQNVRVLELDLSHCPSHSHYGHRSYSGWRQSFGLLEPNYYERSDDEYDQRSDKKDRHERIHQDIIDDLQECKTLHILRLYNYRGLAPQTVNAWMQYGIRNRVRMVWVETADYSTFESRDDEVLYAKPRVTKPTLEAKRLQERRDKNPYRSKKDLPPQDKDYKPTSTVAKRAVKQQKSNGREKFYRPNNWTPNPETVTIYELDEITYNLQDVNMDID
ncbi:hypothetical protein M422DRAFT_35016 [Sphaerobolus stellatus SS14]|uniref:F-box domain-containing protein n=1 Tax=Sphaerobolus stellatus (strain SS14) TaxID=990650 RepID=A0A0C9TWC2_SPHS4|nr:hypothetical protein M422DRAFT_35016 [Sphaerobolus stellatus SS14]